jgi:hypothetical protein
MRCWSPGCACIANLIVVTIKRCKRQAYRVIDHIRSFRYIILLIQLVTIYFSDEIVAGTGNDLLGGGSIEECSLEIFIATHGGRLGEIIFPQSPPPGTTRRFACQIRRSHNQWPAQVFLLSPMRDLIAPRLTHHNSRRGDEAVD